MGNTSKIMKFGENEVILEVIIKILEIENKIK